MERNKGQDVPSPSLHGHPAVRPRPRLREALWNDAPPKANREKDIQWLAREWPRCRFEWDWSLSAFASLLCLQFIITCHIYSKRRTFDFFFFLFISTLIFVLLIFACSRKLLGHWAKPFLLLTAVLKKKKKHTKEKIYNSWSACSLQSNESVFPSCRNGFLFHTQSFIFDNQMLFSSCTVCFDALCIYMLYLFI